MAQRNQLVLKPVFLKQFHYWNLWIFLWRFWNRRKRDVCEKGNTEGRERGCRQSLYRGTKNFWQRRWKTYTRFLTSFNTKHLVLWTTPKTFEMEWRNRLKDLWIRSGLHSRKVELSHVKYFHAFLSTLNYVSPIGTNHDKRRWSWDGGGLDRKLSTCLPTNYKKRIISR